MYFITSCSIVYNLLISLLLCVYAEDSFSSHFSICVARCESKLKRKYIVCRMKARRKPPTEMIVMKRHMLLEGMKQIGQ